MAVAAKPTSASTCARKAGLVLPEQPPKLALDKVVQNLIVANVGELVGELAELACPDCGVRFMEFRTSGRFGCPSDYQVFVQGLLPLLGRSQPATRHVGKSPRRSTIPVGSTPPPAPVSLPRRDRPRRLRAGRDAPRPASPEGCRPMNLDDSDRDFRRVASGHRPRKRHRHVLADPAGPQPQRLSRSSTGRAVWNARRSSRSSRGRSTRSTRN